MDFIREEIQYLSEIDIGGEEEQLNQSCEEESVTSTTSGEINRLTPFYLIFAYGININVPLINLSTKNHLEIFYAVAHAGIIRYVSQFEQKTLQAHKHELTSISVDGQGVYLVTADAGEENAVHFWDKTDGKLFYSIFTPHPIYGMSKIALSPNGKYLVTVGNEPQQCIKLWKWSYGRSAADGSWTIPTSSYGKTIKVCFDPRVQEFVMITFENQVVFLNWDIELQELVEISTPTLRTKSQQFKFTGCTYVQNCHECFASDDVGCINVYGKSFYYMPLEESEYSNDKFYVKTVKLSNYALTTVETVDEMIVTGDAKGQIKFYDKRLRILQWVQNFTMESISSISFDLEQRKFKLKHPLEFDEDDTFKNSPDYEDRSDEYETLYAQLVPSDATLNRLPFIIRNFFVVTTGAEIFHVDFMNNSIESKITKLLSRVTAIDVHADRPFMVIGYDIGRVYLINYEDNRFIFETKIPNDLGVVEKENERTHAITVLKYSPQSLGLICGNANGSIWLLNPILLEPTIPLPLKAAKGSIQEICFSNCGLYFAYYDDNSTVCVYNFKAPSTAELMGKVRAHYKPITGILFSDYNPPRLFTIGEDRHLVEYSIENREDNDLQVINSERISQSAIPMSISYLPKKSHNSRHFCITDNQFKFRTINDQTRMCRSTALGPTYECFEESYVIKTSILKGNDDYLIFMNSNRIGLLKLPLDGNPYRFIGVTGHPRKLRYLVQTPDGRYLYTIGENDRTILKWEIHAKGVDYLEKMGGEELQPFYCLIEGGKEGWLYKEMEDLFYYMQILHQGANTLLPRHVSDHISVTEIPDLMRALGFYPTEYEIEDMLVDIRYRNFDETGELQDTASFLDFVKLYINHKPVHGISLATLREAFEVFQEEGEIETPLTRDVFIEGLCEVAHSPKFNKIAHLTIASVFVFQVHRNSIINAIVRWGETFTKSKLAKCLSVLLHFEGNLSEDPSLSFLPEHIDFDFFLNDILGIDMNRTYVEEAKVSKNAVDEEI